MTKAISVRLDPDLLTFIDENFTEGNRSDRIRAVLLWLKQYKGSYLTSVQDILNLCITRNSQAP